jgi:hypothetical protein
MADIVFRKRYLRLAESLHWLRATVEQRVGQRVQLAAIDDVEDAMVEIFDELGEEAFDKKRFDELLEP